MYKNELLIIHKKIKQKERRREGEKERGALCQPAKSLLIAMRFVVCHMPRKHSPKIAVTPGTGP